MGGNMGKKAAILTGCIICLISVALGVAIGYFIGKTAVSDVSQAPPAIAVKGSRTPPKPKDVALLGIVLGRPLAFQECDKKDFEYWDSNDPSGGIYHGSATCYISYAFPGTEAKDADAKVDAAFRTRREYNIRIPLGMQPLYVNDIVVSTLQNLVAEIEVKTTGQKSQLAAFSELERKFGPPRSSDSTKFENGFGAEYEGIRAAWAFNTLGATLEFTGIDGTIDRGRIVARSRDFNSAMRSFYIHHPDPHL